MTLLNPNLRGMCDIPRPRNKPETVVTGSQEKKRKRILISNKNLKVRFCLRFLGPNPWIKPKKVFVLIQNPNWTRSKNQENLIKPNVNWKTFYFCRTHHHYLIFQRKMLNLSNKIQYFTWNKKILNRTKK